VEFTRGTVLLRSIAGNVRRLRERAGLTQEALAESARVREKYVQDVERARALQLSVVVLAALADALGVEVAQLLRPAALPPARNGRPRKTTKSRKRIVSA
jgi:transcriptional regulator with XRE-family HTH domain